MKYYAVESLKADGKPYKKRIFLCGVTRRWWDWRRAVRLGEARDGAGGRWAVDLSLFFSRTVAKCEAKKANFPARTRVVEVEITFPEDSPICSAKSKEYADD